ncbi:MAG: hypothetical protein ACRESC_05400 [Gammaproteobacteria bacterium]
MGIVIFVQSVETVFAAYRGSISPPDKYHALILGTIEAVAAVLFLIPKTMRTGSVALLVILVLAFALHALRGELNLTLLVYAAGVIFVGLHGVDEYKWINTQTPD